MQTSIGRMPVAVAGLIAHPFEPNKIRSFAAQGLVPFGYAVVQGVKGDKQCKVISAASDKFLGVAAHSMGAVTSQDSSVPSYKDKATLPVISFGDVWVPYVGTAPAPGDALYAVATGGDIGKFTTTGTSNLDVKMKAQMVDTATGLVLASFLQAAS